MESLFNVKCVAQVPQAPAEAAWDICTDPSQWKEEGVGGRIRLLTPLLFLGQKKASSWLKNHGAEKVFQPKRVRWSHWVVVFIIFFFFLLPLPPPSVKRRGVTGLCSIHKIPAAHHVVLPPDGGERRCNPSKRK